MNFGFVVSLLITTVTLVHISSSILKIVSTQAPDFRVLFLAAKDLPSGLNPYLNPEIFTGVGYPPNTLLFYLPLIIFPYIQAQAIFVFLSFASTVAVVCMSLKIGKGKVPMTWFMGALSLTLLSFPTKFTLGMGQNNTIAFLILLLSFFFYKKGKDLWSGILLGLAASFKTVFGFFFLFYLLKKRWKLVLWGVVTVVSFVLATGFLFDFGLYKFYVEKVIPPLLNFGGREIYYNQGLTGFVSRLTESVSVRRNLHLILSALLVFVSSLLTLKRGEDVLNFSLFIITLLLIDTLSWQHHFIWLIFPFIVIALRLAKKKDLYLWTILIISYFLVSWNFKNPEIYPTILLSNTFYGASILYLMNVYLLKGKRQGRLVKS